MSFLLVYLLGFAIVLLLMLMVWGTSLLLKDSSIIDIFWGLGFVAVAYTYNVFSEGFAMRETIVFVLVILWGVRLSAHLAYRNLPKGEDFRYQKWREQHGDSYWWISFFRVNLLQGVIMWIVSAPLLAAQFSDTPDSITALDIIGIVVWAIGFTFEALGDWQLMQFKRNPANKGKVMDQGLWRYTRHPNYFGDAMVWWGFFLIALNTPNGFLTIFSPLIMTFLLMRVSGVAMLERTLKETKPAYKQYIESTSAFFPMPPKKLES
ncbi:MAG: DUF1295 domain-containing protein [Aggregatilineales bacterium]